MTATLHEHELFHGGPVMCGVFELNGDVEPHVHDFVEVAVVGHGRGTHVTSRGARDIGLGDVVVLRPGVWHAFTGCAALTVANCCVSAAALRGEFEILYGVPALRRLLWTDPLAAGILVTSVRPEAALEAVAEIGRMAPHRGGVRLLGSLLTVLGTIADGRDTSGPEPVAHPAVTRLSALMAEATERDWTLGALAREVNLDPDHIGRLFRTHLGLSPLAYLARMRAERAAALLANTDLPVSRVGAAVGWSDPTYFARRFRALVGLTPTAYRAAALSSSAR